MYNRLPGMTGDAHDPLYWDDAYPIALLLKAAHPGTDPIAIDYRVLHGWVIGLEGFADDPKVMYVGWLERIQAEWVEIESA
jgi:FeS assembly protein IscX